jgi:hypothetical protein
MPAYDEAWDLWWPVLGFNQSGGAMQSMADRKPAANISPVFAFS